MDEFCRMVQGWAIYFSSEMDGYYATKPGHADIGYTDSEAELIEEIEADTSSMHDFNRGPFAYLGTR